MKGLADYIYDGPEFYRNGFSQDYFGPWDINLSLIPIIYSL
jgi:hypothetical protein